MSLTNAQLSELLAVASEREEAPTKSKALRRASRSAMMWPVEAAALVAAGDRLTTLRSIGPWTAGVVSGWLEDPPEVREPPPIRAGFLTVARAAAILAEHPEMRARADLQMHSLHSDGSATIGEMHRACAERGYEFVALTDHSKGLPIANGMDEDRLAAQGAEIDSINERGAPPRILKAIEMNLSPLGEEDMERPALARLELVLGAFHSKLRMKDDQTERYLSAIRNPTIHVLAHPRGRIFNFRLGLTAEWDTVFAVAETEGVALEIDCNPMRQDLNVKLLRLAAEHRELMFSIGTDAHSTEELEFMTLGVAAAAEAGIPPERILNFWPVERLLERTSRRRTA